MRMAIIKKNTDNECWRGSGTKGTLYTICGNVNECGRCEKQHRGFSITKNRTTIQSNNSTPGYTCKKKKIKKIQPNVHSSFIYNCQDTEAT